MNDNFFASYELLRRKAMKETAIMLGKTLACLIVALGCAYISIVLIVALFSLSTLKIPLIAGVIYGIVMFIFMKGVFVFGNMTCENYQSKHYKNAKQDLQDFLEEHSIKTKNQKKIYELRKKLRGMIE